MDPYTDIEKQEPAASGLHRILPSLADGSSEATSKLQFARCKLAWKNISYSADTPTGNKQILQNVDGCVEKGYPLPPDYS